MYALQCSQKHHLQQSRHGNNVSIKEDVVCVYTHTMESIHTYTQWNIIQLKKKKKGILPFAVTQMDLERIMGFSCGSAGKQFTCNVGDLGSIHRLGRSPGKGKHYPLQYSGLENSKDCRVFGVAKSWTRLSNFQRELCQWNKSDRESQILYCILSLICGIKTNANENIQQIRNRFTDTENKLTVTSGQRKGKMDKIGAWN